MMETDKPVEFYAGTPRSLQVLVHAGRKLQDPVMLDEYEMDKFNLCDEV